MLNNIIATVSSTLFFITHSIVNKSTSSGVLFIQATREREEDVHTLEKLNKISFDNAEYPNPPKNLLKVQW